MTLQIEQNEIGLRIATEDETRQAMDILDNWPRSQFVLVSDVAFPGKSSFYRGCLEGEQIVSGGWIGAI